MDFKFDFDDVRFWVNLTAFLSVAVGVVIGQDFSFLVMDIFNVVKDSFPMSSQSFSIIVGMEGALLGFLPAFWILTYQNKGLLYSKIWMVFALICLLGQILFGSLTLFTNIIYWILSFLCFMSLVLFNARNFAISYSNICRIQAGFWEVIRRQGNNK